VPSSAACIGVVSRIQQLTTLSSSAAAVLYGLGMPGKQCCLFMFRMRQAE